MQRHRLWAIILATLFICSAMSGAHAQVAMDASNMGLVIPGYDSRTCDSSIEGAIRYNSSVNKVQVCHPGGNSCPNIGDTCSDGSIYAGLSPDGNVPMYTTPADAPGTYQWRQGIGNNNQIVFCGPAPHPDPLCSTGESNTSTIFADSASHPASDYCYLFGDSAEPEALGYTDWYLPAVLEIDVLFDNRVAIGGFATSLYWASNDDGTNYARAQSFNSGNIPIYYKSDSNRVRCVRKSSTPPTGYSWTNWGE